MHLYYKLDDQKNVIPCSMDEAEEYFSHNSRFVKITQWPHGELSTVFMPICLNINVTNDADAPVCFESVYFDLKNKRKFRSTVIDRYLTYQEAERGHDEWARRLRNKNVTISSLKVE